MVNPYDERYGRPGYYWGRTPSAVCYRILQLLPPDRPRKVLDIGCGEGRNAVFLARNGYRVTAFDRSPAGVAKTLRLAEEAGVRVEAFVADLLEHRLAEPYDVLFSTGVLQYVPPDGREPLLRHYGEHTSEDGLNVFSVFVRKPFIGKAPDGESTAHPWISGELFTHYRDWRIEYCTEEIFDCTSGGVPHRHAVDRIVARKVAAVERETGEPRDPGRT